MYSSGYNLRVLPLKNRDLRLDLEQSRPGGTHFWTVTCKGFHVPHITKKYHIKARDFIHAGEGSIALKNTLKTLGIEPDIIRRAAVCAYESEMNVAMHGGDGALTLTVNESMIIIEVRDNGPGIGNIGLALTEGYSTALDEYREMGFGAGMGLPNILKNSDSFAIHSLENKGAYLRMCFWMSKKNSQPEV